MSHCRHRQEIRLLTFHGLVYLQSVQNPQSLLYIIYIIDRSDTVGSVKNFIIRNRDPRSDPESGI